MSGGPDKRPRGRPKSVDRQAATAIAMRTYWQEGLRAHSLNALCRRIGLSKPSFYRAFGGEDGLMVAALDRYREVAIAPLLALLADDRPLDQILDAAVVWLTADHGAPAGCLFTRMRLAPDSLGPETAARVRAITQERREAFAACYRRGVERGEADGAIAPELAARYIDAQLTTALAQRAAGESPEEAQALARLALRVLAAAPRVSSPGSPRADIGSRKEAP